MKKLLDKLPPSRFLHRIALAGILSIQGLLQPGCTIDRSGLARIADDGSTPDSSVEAGNNDGSTSPEDGGLDSAIILDGSIVDAQADASIPADAGERDAGPLTVNCGAGLLPGYPLSYGIPTGTSVQAEAATANRAPDAGVMTGISWGDSPTLEYFTFDAGAPSRALGSHIYTSPGTYTATWFLNETECGSQTFTVIDGATTRPSCSSFVFDGLDNIRVGESTTLRLNAFPRSAAPGDSPLTYNFGNLPAVPSITSSTGTPTISVTAQDPPGAGTYTLDGWVVTPRGERANCPHPILTVRP